MDDWRRRRLQRSHGGKHGAANGEGAVRASRVRALIASPRLSRAVARTVSLTVRGRPAGEAAAMVVGRGGGKGDMIVVD